MLIRVWACFQYKMFHKCDNSEIMTMFVGPKSYRNFMVPPYASMAAVDGQISTRPYFDTIVLFVLVNITKSNITL